LGNAALGLHIGSQGGLWQVAVLGFAGLNLRPDGLYFDPHVPKSWGTLRFPVYWHGSKVRVAMNGEDGTFNAPWESGEPFPISLDGAEQVLQPGKPWACTWDHTTRKWVATTPRK